MIDIHGIVHCNDCKKNKFNIIQHKENVKILCLNCGRLDIIYWNGTSDPSKGSMRRLDTFEWIKR